MHVTVKFVVLKAQEVFAAEMANGNPKQDVGTLLLFLFDLYERMVRVAEKCQSEERDNGEERIHRQLFGSC
jgi:hypothetical protein